MADLTQIFGGQGRKSGGGGGPGLGFAAPFGFTRMAAGGAFRSESTGHISRSGRFGPSFMFGGRGRQAPEEPVTPLAPGDPSNTAAAQARQDAAAEASDAGLTDPLVAGRKEALLARRNKGVGLSALGRGLGGSGRVSDLLTTAPV